MPPPLHKSTSIVTYLVQKCAAARSLREARQLHALLLTSKPSPTESPLFVHNNILSMYARCGSFMDTQHLFDKMPQRNIVSYNSLISAYSRSPHHAHYAYRLFDQLEHDSLTPNGLTITSLLQASAGLGDVIVFCLTMDKDVIAWNSIISAHIKNNKIFESLKLFRDMLSDEVNPDQFTYTLVLNACAKLEEYGIGKRVHARVLLSGTFIDLPLQNSLLDMYCSCGDTRSAYNVFSRIKKPDLISWNSILCGFSENGEGEKAMDMFVRFMRVSRRKPDEYTFAAVILGTSLFPASDFGKPLHAQTEKTGLSRSVYVGSTLIAMYFKNDDFISSKKIFDSFSKKDVVIWTDMIAGHVRIGESELALSFFNEMLKNDGKNLDSFALSSALSACADLVTLKQGEMIHSLAIKTGNNFEVCVHSSLVDMYAKNGELKAATDIFSCLPDCDLMCWNSMLTGYGHHGKADEAFRIFFKMLKHGLRPDQVTLLSLLAACNHCGLLEKSRFFWNYMKGNGLKPGRKHYSCMISLLSRAGLWEEAEGLINESGFSGDYFLESWRTVLSSCIKNEDLRGGVYAAERVLEIDVEDSAASVLITKLYGAAGRWDDVSEMRKRMRKLELEKDPGLSWIEVGNDVRVFGSGDGEMRDELSNLMGNLMPVVVEDIA
ncbi:pentatricopeptide repeat-containing protein at3g50420 [Phtheirospermum japonicum]|uniref:Pentatricopeptide repeat-containing protein at3g50420 n=1 Tax=Phtheirospermum japonicum TaxID=374723 RepID=A0A830B8D1_9LAMI|nr:pentatricopeptide repeat-containing protein at3g50420 [Phtheirospermum japonicum]